MCVRHCNGESILKRGTTCNNCSKIVKAQHKSDFSLLLSLIFLNDWIFCLFSSKKTNARLQKGHLEKHGCGLFSSSLPPCPPPTHTHHCSGSSPPSFFPQKQLLSHRNAKPFFRVAQPHHFSFHMSGCAI